MMGNGVVERPEEMATIVQPEAGVTPAAVAAGRSPFRRFAIGAAVLVLLFALPLLALGRFALRKDHDLYSHVMLIPFISIYLAWQKKNKWSIGVLEYWSGGEKGKRSDGVVECWSIGKISKGAVFFLGIGILLVAGRFAAGAAGWKLAPVDSLAWITLAFVVLLIAVAIFTLGPGLSRELAFPLFFLIFMVPFPQAVEHAIETFLQYRSADAAELLFSMVGTPLVRSATAFQLPGFSLEVAPECSGIRSSLVLFLTSLIAGQLFLRTPWKRALFALLVIPLGIIRNGIRIVTIGELCVHVDPAFIDSPSHHRGGPIFFVVSMVPFLLLLWYLRKTDLKKLN